MDTDEAGSVTETEATLNATFADGGSEVTVTGFKYGTDAALSSPTDVAGSGTTSPFTAALTGLTHATQYWAVGYATNAVGTSYGDTITFTTLAFAPTVDTDAAGTVTETEATLNATFTDGGSAVTATGFKYGTDAALSSPTDVAGSGTTSPFTAALTGLTASTQYWAVGYATNAVGTSYGDTITFTTSAAASSGFTCGTSTVTYDGHNYTTVQIGTQCWFKENLRNDNYNDGTVIDGGLDNSAWAARTTGAFSIYNEDVTNVATYGRLYNWYAVTNAAGLCPTGWHVPTDAEWTTLENHLGGNFLAGSEMKAQSPTWDGNNSSGFSGLPAGLRGFNGIFYNLGSYGGWWSSSPNGGSGFNRYVYTEGSDVAVDDLFPPSPQAGFSVRCVQDPASAPTVDTDAAGSVTETDATLNATFTDGGTAVTATGFKYGTDAALSSPTDVAGSGTTSPFTAALTGLTHATQYWAVGYATNAVGTSYGDTITFTTLAFAPTVDTDAAGSVTETEATLNATFTDGGSAVTATGFKYGTDALLTSPTDVAGGGTSSPFTAALTGLTASTQYWAVGYATNSVGTSYGDTITFTTSAATSCSVPSVTYDGYTYTTVSIGTQCWFKENLRNDDYNDGTPIPGNLDGTAWAGTSSGAQAVYGEGSSTVNSGSSDEVANLATYGRLYNWYAVNTGNLCPSGWHVPTDAEWTTLVNALGGATVAGAKLKASSSDTPAWNGDNSSGFSALPGGYRYDVDANFYNQGSNGYWWSSSPNGSNAWNRYLGSGYSSVSQNSSDKRRGLSVRCLQDPPTAPTVDTDAAGSVTETEATLNATFTDGGSAVTATGFKYGTDALLTSPTDVAGGGTTSPFTAALTGLTASTQYWAVGYATNSVGTSYGDTIMFTTSAPTSCSVPSVTYDGYTYNTVSIGSQCWFKENLRNDDYNDGTPIPGNLDVTAWAGTSSGAQAVYGEGSSAVNSGSSDEVANLATYGRLYNWYAVNTGNLCPSGWHVPTDAEWTTLETAVSSSGDALKSSTGWISGDLGTNSSGFSALPGGQRIVPGSFSTEGSAVYFWSSSSSSETSAGALKIESVDNFIYRDTYAKRRGFNVRCVQSQAPTVDTDAAGSVTETEATLNATFTDGGSEVTATGFKYGTDALLTSPTDVAGSGTTSPFTAALTGLTASTQYWAVGYATNSVGTSYGDTITFTTSAAAPSAFTCGTSTVSYDGHNYTTVLIGTQCWFKENLRNDDYNDGTPIPGNLDDATWTATTSGAQTVYGEGTSAVSSGSDNEVANLADYGRLYNWYAVNTGKLCPSGWHVPTDSEWTTLTDALGGASSAGTNLKASSSDTPAWNGDNSSGFSALPGGFRYNDYGDFDLQGDYGCWWSSSPNGSYAWSRYLYSANSSVASFDDNTRYGYSVRCVQDNDD